MAEILHISSNQEEKWVREKISGTTAKTGTSVSTDGTEYQKWQGFGGCFNELGWKALNDLNPSLKNMVIEDLFHREKGFRFNYCRLPIGANDYSESWYSHNENDGDFAMKKFSIDRDGKSLIPYIRKALALQPEMKLFASPWSPPSWLKHPKAYNYGTLVWDKKHLEAYSLYFVKFVQAYKKAGIKINAVHVQNEPNSDQKFPSCLWTGEKMRDFIRDHLGPAFERNSVKCGICAGTIERGDYNAWANTILSDPGARKFISGIGYQWAGKEAVQKTYMSWPEIPIIQTENECGDGSNTWDYACYVFDLIHHYISNGASAYVYWNMILNPRGLSTWGWKQNSMMTADPVTGDLILNPEYYVMKHFSHFIDRGAVRLGLSGHWASNTVAFRNPSGETVLVIKNPFNRESEINLKIGNTNIKLGLKAKSFNSIISN